MRKRPTNNANETIESHLSYGDFFFNIAVQAFSFKGVVQVEEKNINYDSNRVISVVFT